MVNGNSQTIPCGLASAMPPVGPGHEDGNLPIAAQASGNSTVVSLFKDLRTRFLPMLSLAMHTRGTTEGRAMEWREVARQMQGLADDEQALPVPEGLERQDLEDCRLAIYTMVDEILLSSPREGESSLPGWFAHSLQVARLGNASGGDIFFRKLSDLLFRTTSRPDPNGNAKPDAPADPMLFQLAGPLPGSLPDTGSFSGQGMQGHYQPGQQGGIIQGWMPQLARIIPVESLPACLDSLYPDQPRSSAACSAMAALCLFALCLLYGFRGRLFGQQNAIVANALCRSASGLLFRLMNATLVSSVIVRKPGQPAKKRSILRSPFLLFLLPVLLSGIWYLVCAEIVNKIPLP